MRRPIPLKQTRLKAADFKLIGEIVVLSGMIEDTLKRMPLAVFNVDYIPGIALTTHLKASSLCDMIAALIPYFVDSEDLIADVEEAIKLVRRASDARNDIAHGPFWFFNEGAPIPYKGTRRFTARSKVKLSERPYETEQLKEVLALHIEAWQAIADCFVGMFALAEIRADHGEPPLRPDFAPEANRQKRD